MIVHLALSVRGALHWSDAKLRGLVKHSNGRPYSGREARDWLLDQLAQGRELLPMHLCEGFDYRTGCPGHPDRTSESLR